MSLPEDQNLPDLPIIPDENASSGEPVRLPPARRRRLRRTLNLPGGEERAHILERLGRRAFPAFEFFLFALLCGAILGAGYLLDSHSLLLLGILLAPLMTPWVGLTLSMATGSWRFFFMTLAGLILGFALIFLGGFLAGLVARTGPSFAMSQATNQAHLWWPNLGVLALGAVLLVASFVRSEEKPLLASAMVAYELYLPLSAAGYGLGRGTADIWPNAMLVFVFHFALAVLLGMITLFVLRFRPSKFFGYLLPVTVILVSLVSIFFLSGLGNILSGFFSPQPVALPTLTAAPATATFASSSTPLPTVRGTEPATSTPTLQIPATPTPSQTPTAKPTPVYALISSSAGDGALVRSEADGGVVIASLLNGYLVEILPDPVSIDGVIWLHIRTADGIEGWVLQSVLSMATPVPTP